MNNVTIRCFNLEDSYGFQVMVDQLTSEGLEQLQAMKIAKQWFKTPKCDQGLKPDYKHLLEANEQE